MSSSEAHERESQEAVSVGRHVVAPRGNQSIIVSKKLGLQVSLYEVQQLISQRIRATLRRRIDNENTYDLKSGSIEHEIGAVKCRGCHISLLIYEKGSRVCYNCRSIRSVPRSTLNLSYLKFSCS